MRFVESAAAPLQNPVQGLQGEAGGELPARHPRGRGAGRRLPRAQARRSHQGANIPTLPASDWQALKMVWAPPISRRGFVRVGRG
eukprot:957879-Pyramimonas_sp.AAC.4